MPPPSKYIRIAFVRAPFQQCTALDASTPERAISNRAILRTLANSRMRSLFHLPDTAQLHRDDVGRPYFLGSDLSTSISYTDRVAVVGGTPSLNGHRALGVDVVPIDPSLSTRYSSITAVESNSQIEAQASKLAALRGTTSALLLWSIREASCKACDLPLIPSEIHIDKLNARGGFAISLHGTLRERAPRGFISCTGRVRLVGTHLILAHAICEKREGPRL